MYAFLFLLFGFSSGAYAPPKMTKHPEDVMGIVDNALVLTCIATGDPPPVYTWMKNNKELSVAGTRIKAKNGDLIFEKFKTSDAGNYQCVVRVNAPGLKSELKLLSRVAKVYTAVTPFKFKQDIQAATGYAGGAMRFAVDASNFESRADIAWNYRGRPSITSSDTRFTVLPNGVLQIRGLTSQDSGELRAIARTKSQAGTKSGSIVYGSFQKVEVLSAAQRPSDNRLLYFLARPQSIDLKWGQSTILEALADSANSITYVWYKDGQRIAYDESKSLVGGCNLKLLYAKEEDAGTYKVVVTSGGRTLEATATVNIISAPKFTEVPPARVTGFESKSVTFKFKLNASPKSKILWYHDGVLIDSTADYVIFRDDSLTLDDLIPADSGMYQAIAENAEGIAEFSLELVVLRVGNTSPPTVVVATGLPDLVPSQPRNFKASYVSSSDIMISWLPPETTNGNIRYYKLFYSNSPSAAPKIEIIEQSKRFHNIQNLESGTTYTITLQAFNSNGAGTISTKLTATTLNTTPTPSKVDGIKYQIIDGRLRVTWNASPSREKVTTYQVVLKKTPSGEEKKAITYYPSYEFIGLDLSPGTSYEYYIVPISDSIRGDPSDKQSLTVPKVSTKPDPVPFVSVVAKGAYSVEVRWKAPYGYVQPTSYFVYYKNLHNSSPFRRVEVKSNVAVINNLTPQSTYQFYVVGVTNGLESDKSSVAVSRTHGEAPPAPSELRVTMVGPTMFKVEWKPIPLDSFRGELKGYQLIYSKSSTPHDEVVISNIKVTEPRTKVTKLEPLTEYIVVVKAYGKDDVKSPPSEQLIIKTRAITDRGPTRPINFLIQNHPDRPRNLMFSWDPPIYYTGSILNYVLYYREKGTSYWYSKKLPGTFRSYNVTNFNPNSVYEGKIEAIDKNDLGDETKVKTGVTLATDRYPPSPTGLKLKTNADSVIVTWNPPAFTSNTIVYGYHIIVRNQKSNVVIFEVNRRPGRAFTGLQLYNNILPNTEYMVTVRSYNDHGESGDVSAIGRTPIASGSAILVRSLKENKRTMFLKWTDERFLGSVNSQVYDIKYNHLNSDGSRVNKTISSSKPEVIIDNLVPYTPYTFYIKRRTDEAFPKTPTVVARTLEDVPSAPLNVKSYSDSTWLLLKWQAPKYPNGIISHYKISFSTFRDATAPDSIVTKSAVNAYNVTDLYTNTKYYFRVYAINGKGESAASNMYQGDTLITMIPPVRISSDDNNDGGWLWWWWLLLLLLLLLFLLLLVWCCCYCCCWGTFLRCCFTCCPCFKDCWSFCCLPCLACCCPCCCKKEKEKKGESEKYLLAVVNGKNKEIEGGETWKEKQIEMIPLARYAEQDLLSPSTHSAISGFGTLSRRTSKSSEVQVKVPIPGDITFISYKTSLQDYCQKVGWHAPVYLTEQFDEGFTSRVTFGGGSYNSGDELGLSRQEGEQRAAYFGLIRLGCIDSGSIYSSEANIVVPAAGDMSFISYKCSLHDFCQQCNILPPRFITSANNNGYSSSVQIGSHTFNMLRRMNTSYEAEQNVAYIALQGLCMLDSQAAYFPEACFTVPGPGDDSFISYKSSLHDFCQKYKLPPPQYITNQGSHGYSAKLKFGGLFFQSSSHFNTRLHAEQHAAFEALQGLGLLESTVQFVLEPPQGSSMTTLGHLGTSYSRNSSRPASRSGSRIPSRHGSRSSSRHGSLTHLDQTTHLLKNFDQTNHSVFSSSHHSNDVGMMDMTDGVKSPSSASEYDNYNSLQQNTALTTHSMQQQSRNRSMSDRGVHDGSLSDREGKIRNGSVNGDPTDYPSLTAKYNPNSFEKNGHFTFVYTNGPSSNVQRSLSVGHHDGGLGAGMTQNNQENASYVMHSSAYATLPKNSVVSGRSYAQRQHSATTNNYTYARNYSSSHNIHSSSYDYDDVPLQTKQSKTASHITLPDIEKEMESLEGLIKDLNGMTNSGTIPSH